MEKGKESKLAVALAADPSPNHAAGRVRVVCERERHQPKPDDAAAERVRACAVQVQA